MEPPSSSKAEEQVGNKGPPQATTEGGAYESDEEEEDSFQLPGTWQEGDSLAPPCQSEYEVVDGLIQLAYITSDDVFYDLGSGEGRICLAVAKKTGARAIGVEIEPHLIEKFHRRIHHHSLQDQVTALHCDLRTVDLSSATIIYLYLLPEALAEIMPLLTPVLSCGRCRVVCNSWGLPGITPKDKRVVGALGTTTLRLYDHTSLLPPPSPEGT